MGEFLASTKQPLDDSVISFKSIDSGVDDRAEMTEENLEDTIVYKDPDKRPGLEEVEFEQTREPEETLTEQLNKKKSVPKMTYVSSDGTESDKKKQSVLEELKKAPQPTYYLPLKGNPLVNEYKSLREEITPRGDSMGIVIEVPEWEEKFNTKIYGVDRRYGIIYAIEGKEWGRFVKACNSFPQKEFEEEDEDKAIVGSLTPKDVKSPESQAGVPLAESTRKKEGFQRVTIKDLGASHSDLGTIGFSESSTDAATSSEGTTRIHQEIEEARKATKILEEERLKIEQERLKMIKEQHELAKKRLIEVKRRRKEVIGAMIKESETLQRQKELTTELRAKRRGEIKQQFIDQLVKEEHHFDEYLKNLGPNYAESVALSHETDMSLQWAIPKVGDETKVAMLWADYARIDSHLKCLEKEFEHIKANTETTVATYVEYGRRKERTMKKLDDLRKVIFQYMNEENEKEKLQLIQDDP